MKQPETDFKSEGASRAGETETRSGFRCQFGHDPLLYPHRGIAAINTIRFQILSRDRAGGEHGVTADAHPGTDKRRRTNPCSGLHMNRLNNEIESGGSVIVIAGAEKGPLRKADMATNHDGREIEQPAFLTDPDMVADLQPPGEMDVHAGANDHAPPDSGAKQSQPKDAERTWPRQRRRKKQAAHQHPKRLLEAGGAPVKMGGGEVGQIHESQVKAEAEVRWQLAVSITGKSIKWKAES